jgi:hypothetical protein
VDQVAPYFGLRVIAGEAVVGVNGWRDVVDQVTSRDRDLERIGVARRALEFNGKLARLFGEKRAWRYSPVEVLCTVEAAGLREESRGSEATAGPELNRSVERATNASRQYSRRFRRSRNLRAPGWYGTIGIKPQE